MVIFRRRPYNALFCNDFIVISKNRAWHLDCRLPTSFTSFKRPTSREAKIGERPLSEAFTA